MKERLHFFSGAVFCNECSAPAALPSVRAVKLRVLHDCHEVGTGESADFHDFIKFLFRRGNFRGAPEAPETGDLPDVRES